MAHNYQSVFSVIVLLLPFNIRFLAGNEFAGPYDVIVKQTAECEGYDDLAFKMLHPRISMADRNVPTFESTLISSTSLDDSLSIVLDVSVWGNGGWKDHFYQMEEKHFCKWLSKMAPDMTKTIFQLTGVDDFPVPPGEYNLSTPVNDIKVSGIDSVMYGKYKCQFITKRDSKVLGCLYFIAEIVPKKVQRKKKNRS